MSSLPLHLSPSHPETRTWKPESYVPHTLTRRERLLPVSLVIGFLGSGKTTFLRQVIAQHRHLRLGCLVNEFSPGDMDGLRLRSETAEVIALPGGSVFCRCLVSQFVAALRQMIARAGDPIRPLQGVMIEASGVANPKVIEVLLCETRLDQHCRLASIVAIVDPGSFLKLRHTLPNIDAQVEAADMVILNKADCYPEVDLARTQAALREIRPGVPVLRATHAVVSWDLFAARPCPRGLQGTYAPCRDPNFEAAHVPITAELNLEALRRAFSTLTSDIYRAKGFVRVKGQSLFLDYSESGLHTHLVEHSPANGGLVFVFRAAAKARVAATVLDPLGQGLFDAER